MSLPGHPLKYKKLVGDSLRHPPPKARPVSTMEPSQSGAGIFSSLLRGPDTIVSFTTLLFCYALTTSFVTTNHSSFASFSLRSLIAMIYSQSEGDSRKLFDINSRSKLFQQSIGHETKYVSNIIIKTGMVPDEAKLLARTIVLESKAANLDPLLVTAIIKKESTFRRHAVSNRGATGLMQVMPSTGKFVSEKHNLGRFDSSRLKDPSYNIQLGVTYLKRLSGMFGHDLYHTLIAYNWGPANLSKALKQKSKIPNSTINYAHSIIKSHRSWQNSFTKSDAL